MSMADSPAPLVSRVILHADMDAFFAAVEQLDHPQWRGCPVIVGAPPDRRGVVAAASYEARRFGVHSAMPSREAGRRCPHAVFTPPRGARYAEMSCQIMKIFDRFTPLVEPLSIDEAFLDVTGAQGLFGPGPAIAAAVKQTIREETGLTVSVGVAHNKFLAKLASDLEKPDGLTVVPADAAAVRAFLAPLPVTKIWGVGKKSAAVLAQHGIHTVGDLQRTLPASLRSWVGASTAAGLLELAVGRDERELELEREPKSMSREHTFAEDSCDYAQIRDILFDLTDDVARRLRAQNKFAGLAVLKIRWQGFETRTRQRPFLQPVHDDFSLRRMADALLQEETLDRPVRLIGFGAAQLCDASTDQLELFASPGQTERLQRLSAAVDQLRLRLGPQSIGRGRIR